MKSIVMVILITACAIAHSGNQYVRRVGNGRLVINPNGISPLVTQQLPPIYESLKNRDLSALMLGRRHILPLKAPEYSLHYKTNKIRSLPTLILYKTEEDTEPEIPLSAAYADSPRHPLGNKKDTKPSPANKKIQKQPYKVMPPPLVRNLEPFDSYEEEKQRVRKIFAMTPMDEGYFAPTEQAFLDKPHELGENKRNENVRDIRQNPIPKNAKTLVADDLDKLRQGLDTENFGSTAEPIDGFGSYFNGGTVVYWVLISAGVTASLVILSSLIVYGVYFLVKRAKAAAAVDYPAYGVTGPTADTSGDRRLAQSAQMYHYQHQKQILAMERTMIEQRDGSLSGPESEEENEEGDYTVYECPGFATTGDIEVKNPWYSDPTPATPGKVQVLQTQPKE